MTEDELRFAAERYIAPRLTILPLPGGRFAVGTGYNPPEYMQTAGNDEALGYIILAEAARLREAYDKEIERQATLARCSDALEEIDFEAALEIDLSDLGL